MAPKDKPGDSGAGTVPGKSPKTPKPPSRNIGQEKPADDNVERPGKQFDESYKDYDKFFAAPEQDWVRNLMWTLPELANTIRQVTWTYRYTDDPYVIRDQLALAGVWDAYTAKTSGGGRGYSGGGGGGGATKEQQYAQAEATIRNQVRSMGIAFNDESIKSLAKVVVDNNWSNDMVTDYVVAGAGDWNTVQAGQLTAMVDSVQQKAAANLITISPETARDYARRVASGELTEDGINAILLNQAKTAFSWLTPQLDAGLSVRDVLMPSRDVIARELELPAETINLMDSKWQSMLVTKEANGAMRAATNDELIANARKTSEWQATKGARDLTTAAMMRLRSIFMGG